MGKVLVACEYSGIVRDAFLDAGHDAISCDILPSESDRGEHYQGDIRDILAGGRWDLIIAHPPCTFLANSGARWLYEKPGRWAQMRDGAAFFRLFLETEAAPRIAIENPIIHRHAAEEIGRRQDQTIQPWQFGHGETKAIALWLRNLPPLVPTDVVEGREARVWRMGPSADRQRERSRFFRGIAAAMASQWGAII